MVRFVILVTLLGLASLFWVRQQAWNPLEPTLEGRTLRVTADDVEARFFRSASFRGGAMLFGGIADETRNALWNAHMAWIDLAEARWLMQQYPDFHRCASPGADHAKRMVQDHALIAADGRVRSTLQEAVRAHEAALAAGGDRVCVEFAGEELDFEQARFTHDGQPVDARIHDALRANRFRYVTEARIVDCREGR